MAIPETEFWNQFTHLKPANQLEVSPFLNAYTPAELICKHRYELRHLPTQKQAFIDSIPQSILNKYLLPLPERLLPRFKIKNGNQIIQSHILLFSEKAQDIYIEKHIRYMPAFIHQHDFFEIMYVYSGSCNQVIDDEPVKLMSGDVCLIAPFVSHQIEVDDDSIVINIHIRTSTFQSTFFDLLENSSILSVFFNRVFDGKFQNQYLLFQTYGDAQLRSEIERLILEYVNQKKYYLKIINAQIQEFFGLLLRKYEKNVKVGSLTSSSSKKTIDLITYVQNNFMNLKLSELAEKFHYSIPYLSALIKKQTGVNFTELIRNLKLKKSIFLLATDDLAIQEIAFQSGFNSEAHFIRSFKNRYATTPAKYRKQLQQNASGKDHQIF